MSSFDLEQLFCSLDARVDWKALRQMLSERWQLGALHGVSHWDRVLCNGLQLAGPGVNRTVVACFAYLHDSCREDDCDDLQHGPRAASWMVSLRGSWLSGLTDEEFDLLQRAVRDHTLVKSTGNLTIDTCFDADRLDLTRSGIIPDPSRMASPAGVRAAEEIARRVFR